MIDAGAAHNRQDYSSRPFVHFTPTFALGRCRLTRPDFLRGGVPGTHRGQEVCRSSHVVVVAEQDQDTR